MDQPASRPAFASWLDSTNDVTAMFVAAGRIQGMINLGGGLPDPAVYPVDELADMAKTAVLDHPGECLNYAPIDGLPDLRDLIAERMSGPGLQLARENVIITSGGMQGLELVGKVLVEPGDVITAQSPAYLGALDSWLPRGPSYRLIRTDLEDQDFVSPMRGAKFTYTVPNFSNPSGWLVTPAVRRALVSAAHETGTWLVEDDPYGGLLYDGEPLQSMLSLSAASGGPGLYNGPVIYMGTISKSIAPGLRVGWVIAAPEMIRALTMAKQGSDIASSGLSQRVALSALSSGLVERLQPEIISLYRERRDALLAALSAHLGEWFEWSPPAGGMFIWARAKDPSLDTQKLLPAALEAGICFSPGRPFDPDGKDRRSLRLNFTLNTPAKLTEGIERLARVMKRRSEWDC